MKRFNKLIILTICLLTLCGCSLPFQSDKYPAWNTKGLLESYMLVDGRIVDGWMGASIKQVIKAKWYEFVVNEVNEINEYNGYKPKDNKKLIQANITITNTSDKDVFLFEDDFALIWDLEKDQRQYITSIEPLNDKMLRNEMVVKVGETINIDTVYEIDKSINKPMAIYYYEQYSDGQKGNKYYIYIK